MHIKPTMQATLRIFSLLVFAACAALTFPALAQTATNQIGFQPIRPAQTSATNNTQANNPSSPAPQAPTTVQTAQAPPTDPFEHRGRAFVPDDTRPLIAGDLIRFQVFEDEEPPQILQVSDSGRVDFPYVGQFIVQGKTCKTLAEELTAELEKSFYKKATVFVGLQRGNPVRGKVYLYGEVNRSGQIGIPADTRFTLSKAIMAAGGFTQYAKRKEVQIIRQNPKTGKDNPPIYVDMAEIFDGGSRDEDPVLKAEDYIFIPKSWINF